MDMAKAKSGIVRFIVVLLFINVLLKQQDVMSSVLSSGYDVSDKETCPILFIRTRGTGQWAALCRTTS
jgi:hypothetical protein